MDNKEQYEKRVFIGVYGCQMNVSDAEHMEGLLATIGYRRTEHIQEADLILLNTCCVRETAEDKVYGKVGEILHLKNRNPNLLFGITGCMAQKEGESLIKRAPHIDFVLGTNKLSHLLQTVQDLAAKRASHVVDTALEEKEMPEDTPVIRGGQLSAWVPIMYGCNNFCTYCIVPYVRGRERSRRPTNILREVRDAVAAGFREVTLLGQNVNSYGKDHKEADFSDLLTMIDALPGVERVRYMTSHPKDFSPKLITTVQNSRHICEHFHLPVQHGSDRILQAMNRNYTTEQYRAIIQKIRTVIPHASITTDIIVGFPGETDTDFQNLLRFIREIRFDAAYTFLYSPRSGTPATTYENQVDDAVKRERLNKLMQVQDEISLEINQSLLGETMEVYVEGASQKNPQVWKGRTRTNKIVLWEYQGMEAMGDLARIRISKAQTWLLKGELVSCMHA